MPGPRRRLLTRLLPGLGALATGAVAAASPSRPATPGVAHRHDPEPAPATGETVALPETPSPALAGRPLRFPQDFGAHPDFRIEWWYLTAWLETGGRSIGAQLTFFRSRTGHDPRNPSRFAPTQLLLAHAAVAVDGERRLRHDQRAARAGFGLAGAATGDTDVWIGANWRLRRTADDRLHAQARAREFALDLHCTPAAPPWPQGRDGWSRKGPLPTQASHYYSRPQLAVDGRIALTPAQGQPVDEPVSGRAWLDHEWSSELLDPGAEGWDWVGLNFDDGSALMAFRIRASDGRRLWSDARWMGRADAGSRSGGALSPVFEPIRHWRSPRTGARWPVAMRLTVGERTLTLTPIFDDQELDTRASVGTIYWEGAVRVFEQGRQTGRGYLELTGYAGALRL